jgi:hypothetical protein
MEGITLPPEIIRRIILFLTQFHPPGLHHKYYERLPEAVQYASVSRFWQDEIERETFAELRLNLRKLSELNTIVTPRCRGLVRKIKVSIQLPSPGPRGDPENDDERLRNNRALQATLEAFLLSLGQWDAAEVRQGGIQLCFCAPLPHQERDSITGKLATLTYMAWDRKYRDSVLELTDPKRIAQLPSVIAITKLKRQDSFFNRHISVLAIAALLAKLPAAKNIALDWWKAVRFKRMRNGNVSSSIAQGSHKSLIRSIIDLANALTQIKHPIDEFRLYSSNFETLDLINCSPTPEKLSEDDDTLSKSIHVLSQHATLVDIENIAVYDEIFFPRALYTNIAEPRWDRLAQFSLNYLPINHSGELLFLPDPYRIDSSDSEVSVSDDSEVSVFSLPNGITQKSVHTLSTATPAIQKLYLVAARAALQMPALKEMCLEAVLTRGEYWHKFRYYIRGSSAEAIWTSSSGFIPEDNVLECWRKVPRKHLKSELEVKVLDEEWAV